jgi:hypothetical protein
MAGGTWSPTEGKTRPGFYMNFIAAALAGIKPGARGVVACPVKAEWGPLKTFVEVTSEAELTAAFGSKAVSTTAWDTIRMALLGGAKTVLGYRLADGDAAKGTLTLKDTTGAGAVDVLRLDTKYESARDFRITTRTNPVDSSKQDVVLYEGTTILRTFTFTSGTGGTDNAVAAINGDTGNKWAVATKLAAGNGILAALTSQPLTGGDNGTAAVVNQDYTDALPFFEARPFNLFTLDGMTDSALQSSVVAWVKRLREEGKGIIAILGGTSVADADPTLGNARSALFNHEGVVNVITSVVMDGVTYTSAQVAPFIAGLIGGQKLSESITYAVCPFSDVSPRLTHNQIVAALQAGSLVIVHDGEKVKVEQGINSLSSLSQGQNDQWKKIRAIRVMDSINADLLKAASDNYIGKVNNNDEGKVALINACKRYMQTLFLGGLVETDYVVQLDPAYHPSLALPDEVYIRWDARICDNMEKIFGTFMVH